MSLYTKLGRRWSGGVSLKELRTREIFYRRLRRSSQANWLEPSSRVSMLLAQAGLGMRSAAAVAWRCG